MRARWLWAVAAFAAWLPIAQAQAAFPGANGKIAYDSTGTGTLRTVNQDGTGDTGIGSGSRPSWSPDGRKVAFDWSVCDPNCHRELFVMNPDGTGRTQLTNQNAASPSWSPDGQKMAFVSSANGSQDIWTMDSDGSDPVQITNDLYTKSDPAWSPDGKRIAFVSTGPGGVQVMNADGSGGYQPITPEANVYTPDWSPDGTKIVFGQDASIKMVNPDGSSLTTVPNAAGIHPAWAPNQSKLVVGGTVMNPDGTGQVTIASSARDPDWQPIVTGYPRPKGATPMLTALVLAYPQCTAPDRTHGPPLAFPSCGSPTPESSHLRVGNPQQPGGAAANMTGSVRFDAIVGVPGPPDDGEDILIKASITDVRCTVRNINIYSYPCGPPNGEQENDYIGELQAEFNTRTTDRFNAVASGGGADAATVEDIPYDFVLSCASTSPAIGGSCGTQTSFNALTPGTIKDGKRAIWEFGQVKVFDAGPDGTVAAADGQELFAIQGLFVP